MLTIDRNKMLDFASRHKIHAIIEKYPMTLAGITEAISRLRESKMRYRGVISWEYNVLTENQWGNKWGFKIYKEAIYSGAYGAGHL